MSKHPLYGLCRRLIDPKRGTYREPDGTVVRWYPEVCERWHHLPHFVYEVERWAGPRPHATARLVPLIEDWPIGPGNVTWE